MLTRALPASLHHRRSIRARCGALGALTLALVLPAPQRAWAQRDASAPEVTARATVVVAAPRMAVGLEAVPTAQREEDGASAGVRDRGGEDLVALAGSRLGELGPEPLDAGVNGSEVGAVGEPEDAGLQEAHAIERGGVVHRERP